MNKKVYKRFPVLEFNPKWKAHDKVEEVERSTWDYYIDSIGEHDKLDDRWSADRTKLWIGRRLLGGYCPYTFCEVWIKLRPN